MNNRWAKLLAGVMLAGAGVLLSVDNAFAAASLTLSSSFTSADPARASAYMDSGGTWNGSSEVTNTTGDRFVLSVQNTAILPADVAYDLAINAAVPAHFRLPTSPSSVTVTETSGNAGCAAIGILSATQAGGPGTDVAFNIPASTSILPGCSYDFDFGLTTDDVPPSANSGSYNIIFNVNYDEVAGDTSTMQTSNTSQGVEVRKGSVSLVKTANTPVAGNGDTVDFTVSLLNSGKGGIFNVVLSDTLSPDLTGLVLTAPATPPGAAGPGGNQYTYEYIAPGQQIDVDAKATVSVDPNALTCPNLRNDASAVERLGTTGTFFDTVPFDLQNPFIDYTPPNITIPYGAAGVAVTVPVQNTGTGVAKNISLTAANLAVYTIVVDTAASPNWTYAGGGVFNYTGTLAAGAFANLTFNVSTTSCPAPADQNITWVPGYKNACGTDFYPPIRFSSTTLNNTPDVNVTKTVSSPALNVGSSGFYTLSLNGTNTAGLPDNGVADNAEFSVTDTLPNGVTGAVINSIPAGTEVLVNGSPYTATSTIADGATITWRGDRADLSPLPSLRIDFTAGSTGLCPVGQTISNTASMSYPSCSINNNDNAGFILNDNPAGGATTNIAVGGDGNFQAGAKDTDGVANTQTREGEHIPFTVSYDFPTGYAGTWSGTSFTAQLRSNIGTGVPLVLTNNRNAVHLTISTGGTPICDADLVPGVDFTGGDGTGPLVITDFGSLSPAGCNALPANMANHDMVITYAATSPEGNLDINNNPTNANNIGNYLETTTLTVNNGPSSCLGTGNTDFTQAANVNIERAVLGISATLNNGNPVSVCSVVPARIAVTGPAANTNTDNIQLQFNDSNFEFVKADGSPGDPLTDIGYSGSLSSLGMTGSRSGNDVLMTGTPNTTDLTADGSASFDVRLRDTVVPGTMAVQLAYDSNHTSPDGAALTDSDRDYVLNINGTPLDILSGQLKMEFFPSDVILKDSTTYPFRAQITNVGTGTAVGAKYRLTLPAGMKFDFADVAPTTLSGPIDYSAPQTIEWDLGDLAAGASANINITTSINQTTCFQNPTEKITSETEWGCGSPIITTETKPGLLLAPHQLTLTHDANNSFCELCNEGEVRLFVNNTGSVLLTNVDVTENLLKSGLTYVPGSTTYFVDGVAKGAPAVDAVVSTGSNGPDELINWTTTQIPELANLYSAFSAGAGKPQQIEIRFRVKRNTPTVNNEGLISADRTIQATANYGLFCGPPPQTASSTLFELPIDQPVPTVTKKARNVDANQPPSAYADTVYGGTADDVIWRVQVTNNGPDSRANLEALILNDTIGGNFSINEVCDSEANATLAAQGTSPGSPNCISVGPTTSTSFNVNDPFGNPGNDEIASFIDVLKGGETYIYFVGKIQNTCTNHTNSVDIAWGCQSDSPGGGGITTPATSGGVTPAYSNADTAALSTAVDPAGVIISQTVTGRNPAQPLGASGIVTVTIRNNSGGSVRGITLDDVLPAGYALDQTLMTAVDTPAFGAYPGMIDTINLTNPQAAAENNTSPSFTLTSSGVPPAVPPAPQNNLLRHGDVLTITLGIVKKNGFDIVADPEVRVENTGDGTDPSVATPLNNQATVVFENTCGSAFPAVVTNLSVSPAPEDLDININPTNADLIYILSDPTASLSLDVRLTNNGGNDASDYFTYVTVGSGLQVTAVPPGCAVTSNPPARAVWIPALPATATVYQCSLQNPLPPSATDSFVFNVQKQNTGADLTFRADVVGEITLSDGTPLTYPAPDTATILNTANNYSLDSIRARLIGFNLTKVIQGNCTENNPAPVNNNRVQIGEDCTYRMEAGWFGFATPGFGSIQIKNVKVTDTNPAGQGFISQDTSNSSAGITNITSTPASPTPLTANNITWQFDPFAGDDTFSVDLVTRTLNEPLNSSAPPNVHGANRTDTVNASFDVDFGGTTKSFNSTTPGYPPASKRRASVRVIEPHLIITKEVCDETIYGVGPACTTFVPLVNEGDTNDDYVYRVSILNEATAGGYQRAPAYDVDITDVLDSTDLLTLDPNYLFYEVDNTNNGSVDASGPLPTPINITDNAPNNGTPGVLSILSSTAPVLQKIDPGQKVMIYYRANPDDAAAPGQQLKNSVTVDYDTLPGVSGNQNAPQEASGTAGGARKYTTAAQSATIEITSLTAPPDSKGILALSNTPLGGAAPFVGPQNVAVGEEIQYQLKVDMPVANLNNFIIRDVLPVGLKCIEGQTIDLSAAPYSSAGFTPGGSFPATCSNNGTNDVVEWNFGNQQLTIGPTFTFTANFIARVENTASNRDGVLLRNGGTGAGSTLAILSYDDAGGNPVVINLGPADVTVSEPKIVLDKVYAVASADADDELTVTVTATNTGTLPAYNVRVLDDLAAVADLTYVSGSNSGNVTEDLGLGPNRPVFTLNPVAPIAAGANVSFSFKVKVSSGVQPLEVLDNTVQAAWTSLPNDTTSLNSGGSIGADGSATGMRTGAIPNVGNTLNNYEATFTNNSLLVPTVAVTKTDLNPAVVTTIGERKKFELDIAIPEGVTNNLKISDDLFAASGLPPAAAYVLEDTAGYSISYSFSGIASINGTTPASTAFTSVPVNGASGVITWNIGKVVTNTEDDSVSSGINPSIHITYYARINNDISTNAGDAMLNSASAEFTSGEPPGATITTTPVAAPQRTVLEPALTVTKTFSNVTPGKNPTDLPDGGDTIEYVLTLNNTGTSTAFDTNIVDTLPAALQLDGSFTPTATIGGTPVSGFVSAPDGAPAGPLIWGNGKTVPDESLDIPAGQSLVLTYRVTLQNNVLADLAINNSVLVDWTSLNGSSGDERTGAGCPSITAPNDYCTGPVSAVMNVSDNNSITKNRLSDTSPALAAPNDVRIGDIVDYELHVNIQEGTSPAMVVTDTLPKGLAFEGVLSVNGDTAAPYSQSAPFSYSDISAPTVSGNPATGPSTVTWNLGTIINAADNNTANNDFVIVYRARVLNLVQSQQNSIALTNTANLNYTTANGAATPKTGSETVTILQPNLSVSKSAAPAGGDNLIDANELIDYTVDVTNNGTAPAYDLELRDIIPVGLRNGAATITMLSTELPAGTPVASLPPVYDAVTGNATWNFDTGAADAYTILPGETLRIVYRVQADATLGPGLTMTNSAQAWRYYSFDNNAVPVAGTSTGVREIYGPSNIATATVSTVAAGPLSKQNPANLNASIGEPFTYRITVPAVPETTALHDVRILDDLTLSAADMEFVSVTRISGSQPWTPVNVGTSTSLIIQDSGAAGIEIPAGQQIQIDITVQLRNQPVNSATPPPPGSPPLTFTNTARYTFNAVDGVNCPTCLTAPVVTSNMTVVEPNLTITKLGPPTAQFGTPIPYTLDVRNIGTGPAHDITVRDHLPKATDAGPPETGGTCDTAPNNFVVQVTDNTPTVLRTLVQNVDYKVAYTAAPTCELVIKTTSSPAFPNAILAAGEHLVINYDAFLDVNTMDGVKLTNSASVTEWFSADTAGTGATGEVRTYPVSPVAPATHTITTESPALKISKHVFNANTGLEITTAEPGDELLYKITITNTGSVPATNFNFTDEPDRLNGTAYFESNSITLPVVAPAMGSPTFNPVGGTYGSGVVNVSNLSLDASGGPGINSVTISFKIKLIGVITSGTKVYNQAEVALPGFSTLLSDDPDNTTYPGPADPTVVTIGSAPSFSLQKKSEDLTGDPNVLRQGDTLRYTITAKNIGIENAKNVMLRDQVPANSSYVAGSTTLNGVAVADPATGVSPLQNGILIHAPEDSTAGNMRADSSATTTNVATITFSVVVDSNVVNGTVISNQAFVTGQGVGSGPFPTQQSDDPRTVDVIGDPTKNIVGNLPILDVQKTVAVSADSGSIPNVVDAGDTLIYTFVISNAGVIPATGVVLTDAVPTNSSYVANSVTVNGTPIADTVPGVSPLIAGIDISSSDQPPPATGKGQVTAGHQAIVTMKVTVTGAAGDLISNQGSLTSNELPEEPTDADGNDENGDQPTVIAIGAQQQLAITKEVKVVGGGVARAGGQLEYIIRVENISTTAADNVVITDDINTALMSYVAGSGQLNGNTADVSLSGTEVTATYPVLTGPLKAGSSATLTFTVNLNAGLADGTTIGNTAKVTWGTTGTASATASVDIGSAPGIAVINGTLWHDANFNKLLDSNERLLENWGIQIYLKSQLLDTVYSDAQGQYRIIGLIPSSVAGGEYELRFVAPNAGGSTALLGKADSTHSAVPFVDSLQKIGQITVAAGSNTFNLNLPIDPNGVVYNAVLRTPVAGATLTMLNASNGIPVPASCFDDPAQQNQITNTDGYYKFDMNFSVPGNCNAGAAYVIQIKPPASGYVGTTSVIIPPARTLTDPPFNVPTCPGSADDQLSTVPDRCEIQNSAFAPVTSIAPRTPGTNYYMQFTLGNSSDPFTSQIFNNHIPLDPDLGGAIAISKTSALLNVTRSQLVPYTITLNNTLAAPLQDLNIVDTFPAGFKYVAGSARLDDVPTEPMVNGRQLTWQNISLNTAEVRRIKLLLVVGSGVSENDYVNLAQAFNNRTSEAASKQASATVRVVPDPTFDCSDIIGKVFDDKNMNGYQDQGEMGIPSARVYTARGIEAKTDKYGRFHITCAVVPNEDRGSNFIMKLDERSLPSGYRVTTENPRVERATRGKMLKFNFGAAIHHVVRLDMADAVFKPGSTDMRPQWESRLNLLMEKLVKAPSILRLSYMGDVESEALVEKRVSAVKKEIARRWADLNCCYRLEIETEVFWRRGKPASKGDFK